MSVTTDDRITHTFRGLVDCTLELLDEPKSVIKPVTICNALTTDQRIAYLRCLVRHYDTLVLADIHDTLKDAAVELATEIDSLRRQINPEFFKDV